MDYLEEQQKYWDGFADEYYTIQQESFTTIAEDVAKYLLESQCLPCDLFVDLAGGYGKYLPAIAPYVNNYLLVDFSANMLNKAKSIHPNKNIQYIQSDQETFCANSIPQQYDLVFSAMNPSLHTLQQLQSLLRMAKKQLILIQILEDLDTVFTPLETLFLNQMQRPVPFKAFKKWLAKEDLPWVSKTFSYQKEEVVTKQFVNDYFEQEQQQEQRLTEEIETLFLNESLIKNTHKITFELLRILK